MALITVTAGKVGYSDADGLLEKIGTIPPAETITAGGPLRYSVTSGEWKVGNATDAPNARVVAVAARSAETGIAMVAIRKGLIDLGNALGGLAYDAPVYLSDTTGRFSTTAGAVSTVIGRVVPSFGHTTADKLLRVDL